MAGPKSDKLWSQAIRMAAMREMEDPNTPGKKIKRLNQIADNLVRAAVAGDVQAMKEIGDRLDGKPAQATTLTGSLDMTVGKRAEEYTDDELATLAAGGSAGASEAAESKSKPH